MPALALILALYWFISTHHIMHVNMVRNVTNLIIQLASDADISPKNAPILYDICNIGLDLHQLLVGYMDKKYLKKARIKFSSLCCKNSNNGGFLNNGWFESFLEFLFRLFVCLAGFIVWLVGV